jgi:hypothetical protein
VALYAGDQCFQTALPVIYSASLPVQIHLKYQFCNTLKTSNCSPFYFADSEITSFNLNEALGLLQNLNSKLSNTTGNTNTTTNNNFIETNHHAYHLLTLTMIGIVLAFFVVVIIGFIGVEIWKKREKKVEQRNTISKFMKSMSLGVECSLSGSNRSHGSTDGLAR